MDKSTNSLNWFEIPATDMPRAKKFYQNIFGIQMEEMDMMGMTMAGFPGEPGSGKASGALVRSEHHKPSTDGAVIYLNANPDMSPVLEKILAEGGQVVMGKTSINPEIGYMAFFIDTEGNRVALHSQG
jgi:predicted enzyme related to lactoylglutathione lyase